MRHPDVGDVVANDRDRWSQVGWEDAQSMAAFMSVMRAHQVLVDAVHEVLRPHQLSLTDYAALVFLALTEDRRQPLGKIAERLMIGAGRCSYVIDRLEGDGLVERRRHPSDGRTTLAVLTKKGMRRVTSANADLAAARFGFAEAPDDTLVRLVADLKIVREGLGDLPPGAPSEVPNGARGSNWPS